VNKKNNDASLFLLAMCHRTDEGMKNANKKKERERKTGLYTIEFSPKSLEMGKGEEGGKRERIENFGKI